MLCKCCGKDTVVIGYQHSEQLDVEPAKYFVSVTRREKRVCRGCAAGVSAALLPVRIIDKGLVSDRVVIYTLIAKYSDHLPLYRQSVIFERETGLSISRATMDGWVMSVGELLTPVTAAMGRRWVQLAEHRRNSDTVARTIAGKRRHARGLRKARETEGGKSWEFLSPHFDTLRFCRCRSSSMPSDTAASLLFAKVFISAGSPPRSSLARRFRCVRSPSSIFFKSAITFFETALIFDRSS